MAGSAGKKLSEANRLDLIVDAVRMIDLTQYSPAWSKLAALTDQTEPDGIEVDPAGIKLSNSQKFEGLMTIYVVLKYDASSENSLLTTDAFGAEFEGHFDVNQPLIDKISVDTQPFFQ